MNKIYLISDIHFGIKNSNKEWLDLQREYFYDFFIPLAKKEKKKPTLIVAGDVYDNRQSLNILVMNSVIDIFKDLAKVFKEIHIIAGNHDVFLKSSNAITSLESLNSIKNITIYRKEKVVEFNNKHFLLLPWYSDRIKEKEIIKQYEGDVDYLICHTEVSGFKYNSSIIVEDGNDFSVFKKYRNVYSGHFHYRQEKGNFKYIGSPMHFTRNDVGDTKGIYIIDTKTATDTFVENNVSPKFVKIKLDDVLEKTLSELKELTNNNFVDLYIKESYIMKYNVNNLTTQLNNIKDLKVVVVEDDKEGTVIDTTDTKSDILELCDSFLDNNNYSDKDKKEAMNYLTEIYNRVTA